MNPGTSLTLSDWQRLNSLLSSALDLEGAARSAWLAELGPDDQHLRPVLTDLLVQSDATGFATGLNPPTTVARMASEALAAMRREQAGDRIGPWQLERLLAEGGMGAVWVAQRADGVMKRTAALKLPRAEWVDHGLTERIARERNILARLAHPHIAVLYDAGITSEGRPYLALEYVDGLSIDHYLQSHPLILAQLLRLFVQVIRAVAYAHGKLVIHRDLKPGNVLVTADGEPKLLDFGISKLLEGDALTDEDSALTRLAGRPLTLAYAAPEQVLGLPVSVAADVYALGVMLFELTTGSRLYRATEPRELEAEILKGVLRRPSEAATDTTRAKALRGDLDAIVLNALKRQPDERYQSAAALADDLERYLDGQPVQARPDSTAYRLRKFVARNTLAVAAGSAILIALGIGLGIALWQASVARDQAARATAMNAFVLSLIQQADPNASKQTKAADLAMLAAIEERIDTEFKGSPDQLLQLRVTVGDAYKNRGEMMAARRVFQRAVDEAAPKLSADDLLLLTAQVRAADPNLIVSTAASQQLDRAIEILRVKSDEDPAAAELLIDALLNRHELQHTYGVPAYLPAGQRLVTLREANEMALRHFGEGSRQQLRVVRPLAGWTSTLESEEKGNRLLDSSLAQARLRTDGTAASVEFLVANAGLAVRWCEEDNRVAEGQAILRDAISSVQAAHGPTSVLLEELVIALGSCDDMTGHLAPAEAFEIASTRERPPSTALLRRAETAFAMAIGARDQANAERFYQSAIENSLAIPESALRERLMMDVTIGRICQLGQRGDGEEAEALAMPLKATFDAEFAQIGRLTPNQGGFWLCLGDAQRQVARYEQAERTLQTFLERCRATLVTTPKLNCDKRALTALALARLEAGQFDQARAAMSERLKMSRDTEGDPRFTIPYARILLADGRGAEAVELMRQNYGWWLSMQPTSPYAAEALYWFGRAYLAVSDPRGRWMVAQARKELAASPVKTHQRLAAMTPTT